MGGGSQLKLGPNKSKSICNKSLKIGYLYLYQKMPEPRNCSFTCHPQLKLYNTTTPVWCNGLWKVVHVQGTLAGGPPLLEQTSVVGGPRKIYVVGPRYHTLESMECAALLFGIRIPSNVVFTHRLHGMHGTLLWSPHFDDQNYSK